MKVDGPDSKFSWIIAIACCWIYFVMYGLNRLSALLFVDTMTTYNVDRGAASYPYALAFSMRFLAGPISGFFAYKLGLRAVIIFGCMITSIGTGACFLAKNIMTISILWGGLVGLGSGISTCLLKQVNNLYFKKHLVKANGIAYAGGPIAGFVLPPLAAYLLKEYGLSGTFLILSSIVLHSFPAAIILHPPSFVQSSVKNNRKINITECKIHKKRNSCQGRNDNDSIEMKQNFIKIATKVNNGIELKAYSKNNKNLYSNLNMNKLVTVTASVLNHDKENFICTCEIEKVDIQNQIGFKEDIANTLIIKDLPTNQIVSIVIPNIYPVQESISKNAYIEFKNEETRIQNSYIVHDSNSDDLRERGTDVSKDCLSRLSSSRYLLNKVRISLQPFRVYCNIYFIIIGFTSGLHSFFTTVYPTILVDFFMDKGTSLALSTYSLVTFSIADMIGRVALGWVTDGNYMSKTSFCILLFLVYAICCSFLVLFEGFVLLSAVVFLSGICTGGLCPLFAAMITQFIKEEDQTMANSSTELLGAPLAFAAPSLIGIFRDDLGSYNWLMFLQGILSIISSLLLFFLSTNSQSAKKKIYQFQ